MSKRTQTLVDKFRDELLFRRKDLVETLDCLRDSKLHAGHIQSINEEMDRIDRIFKLMENEKI